MLPHDLLAKSTVYDYFALRDPHRPELSPVEAEQVVLPDISDDEASRTLVTDRQ